MNVKHKYNGMSLRKYCFTNKISYIAVFQRINNGESIEDAISNVTKKYLNSKSFTLEEKASIFASKFAKASSIGKQELKKKWYSQKRISSARLDYYWCRIATNSVGAKVPDVIEIWKSIPGHDGYQVSNLSNFRKVYVANGGTSTIYKKCTPYKWARTDREGFIMRISLKGQQLSVAPLILGAFVPKPEGDYVVRFKDGNPCNVALSNMEWVSRSKHGELTGWKCRQSKRVLYINPNGISQFFRSARNAAKELNCSYQTILDICHGKVKKKMYNVSFYE